MRVAVTPSAPRLTRNLKAKGHDVRSVGRRRLGSVREGDFDAVMLVEGPGDVPDLKHILLELKLAAPKTPRVVVTEHVTSRVATTVVEAGGYVTTLASAAALLTTLQEQLTRDPRDPAPRQRLQHALIVPEFHAENGLIDAEKVAAALNLSPSALAKAVGVTPSALSRRATARAAQKGLRELEFVWAALRQEFGSDDQIRAWLNAPHPDLGGEPPLALLTKGSATALADYVRSALAGQPT